ncbi:MAG: hypothetical protein AB1656_01255 [Candidatus Omnitrophota bacterium]
MRLNLKRFWLFDDPRSYGARAILRGAAEGLRAIGKEARLFPFDPSAPNAAVQLREDLLRFRPDAVLLANHPASLFYSQIGLNEPPCPTLVWIFDDPYMMGDERYSPDEIVLAADPGFIEGARARGAEKIYFLPVAAPMQNDFQTLPPHAVPIAYVGAALSLDGMRARMAPDMAAYLDRIARRKALEPAASFPDLLERDPITEGKRVSFSGPLAYYLYTEANRLARLRFLNALAPFGLRLYGNEAWKPAIQGTALESCFKGKLDPFTEYPHLIHSAAININLRSLQGFSAPTQRDFLIPRLGGFMLATSISPSAIDWRANDPSDRFRLSDFPWAPSYETPEAMAAAALGYLQDEFSRREWVNYAAEIIAKNHTFAKRMEQLLEVCKALEKGI